MNESLQAFCAGALNEPGWSRVHWFGFVAAVVMAYSVLGGVTHKALRVSGEGPDESIFGAVLWPFALPWMAGQWLVSSIATRIASRRIPTARTVQK